MNPGPAPCRWDGDDLLLSIHAQPGARQTAWAGRHGDALKIRLRARAVDGAANAALTTFLADEFQVPEKSVRLLSGERGRDKRLRIMLPPREIARKRLRLVAPDLDLPAP